MKYIYSITLSLFLFSPLSIYDFVVSSSDGGVLPFDAFRNKKILIVNIATESNRVGQLTQLQDMQQQFSDRLVIVGFPSNSFGNEPRDNEGIRLFCQARYGVTFLLASKNPVKGENCQPVYHWLANKTENGLLDSEIKGDFQKYLIDENGHILGVFAGSVSPTDSNLIQAILR